MKRQFSWYFWTSAALSCALVFFSTATAVQAQMTKSPPIYQNFSADFIDYINKAVDKVMFCYNVTGLTLAVIDRSKTNDTNNVVLKFTKGYGIKDLNNNAPVDENTKFAIGSITKSFTGATFANFTARKNASFNYDTLVTPILQEQFNTNLSKVDKHFDSYGNFRDLLAHRTGVLGSTGPLRTGTNLTVIEMVKALNTLPILPREFGGSFRESFSYNNWMYALVGALMANADGEKSSWKSLVRETILQPWNIDATFVHDLVDGKDNFANPVYLYANASGNGGSDYSYYFKQDDIKTIPEWLGTNEILSPAGAIAASAEDMARYIEFWNVGGLGTIPPVALKELDNPQTSFVQHKSDIQPPQFTYWDVAEYYTALGLQRGIHNDSVKFSHGGGVGPFISQFSFSMSPYPQHGVFVSTNGPGGILSLYAVAIVEQAVLEALATDGHPREWTLDNVCKFQVNLSSLVPHPKPLSTNILLGNASVYAGQYKHPLMGTVEIAPFNTTHLRWTLGTVGSGFMARATNDDVWQFDMDFEGGMQWSQSALDFPSNTRMFNRTALFGGAFEKNSPATTVILRFQVGSSGNATLPDSAQPVFERLFA